MRTVTGYRVIAGRVTITADDEEAAFKLARELTDSNHSRYSGTSTATISTCDPDGFWWCVGVANWGGAHKMATPTMFQYPDSTAKEPASQNPSFATQVAEDGTQSGRSATEQGSVNCVAKPEGTRSMGNPQSFDAPPGWIVIVPVKLDYQQGFPSTAVCVPVSQILEFTSEYTGVTKVKTSAEVYVTKKSIGEFAQQVAAAQAALLSSLRGTLEGLGVKER